MKTAAEQLKARVPVARTAWLGVGTVPLRVSPDPPGPAPPEPTPTPTPDSNSLSGWSIFGIVVGTLVLILLIVVLVLYLRGRSGATIVSPKLIHATPIDETPNLLENETIHSGNA